MSYGIVRPLLEKNTESRPELSLAGDAHSREICPGGVGFETRSASGGHGAVLVAKLKRPVIDGVSVRVVGIRLGLQISKTDDKRVNANGVAGCATRCWHMVCGLQLFWILLLYTTCSFLCKSWIL